MTNNSSFIQPNKRYVQDLIVENSAQVWQYMAVLNASIIISGFVLLIFPLRTINNLDMMNC
jgi:sulfite reductase alpha subunit-like flavoprotein